MGIILSVLYFIAGIALGYWGFDKLYPYFFYRVWTFLLALIWVFFWVGFVPIWLHALTFKAY